MILGRRGRLERLLLPVPERLRKGEVKESGFPPPIIALRKLHRDALVTLMCGLSSGKGGGSGDGYGGWTDGGGILGFADDVPRVASVSVLVMEAFLLTFEFDGLACDATGPTGTSGVVVIAAVVLRATNEGGEVGGGGS